jgi:co-chaperonin GroES (HSP10)
MQPTNNRVLVRQNVEVVVEEQVVEGEVQKPKVATNNTVYATVLSCGPSTKEVKVGNKVAFSPYGYDEVLVDGEVLIVISEEMILGVIN